jgi:hypothetical protein
MTHEACRRATWHPITELPSYDNAHLLGEWRCYACGEALATLNDYRVVRFVPPLEELRDERDGLKTFGLAQRALTGRTSRRRAGKAGHDMGWHEPVFVYCPRTGVCGRGQHLHDDAHDAIVD